MTQRSEYVEVFEVEHGQGRPHYVYKTGALALLASDAPLPRPGDIVLLNRTATGDTEEQALIAEAAAPFRVLEVEHLYGDPAKSASASSPNPAPYLKSWIHVRRLTDEEYAADPS